MSAEPRDRFMMTNAPGVLSKLSAALRKTKQLIFARFGFSKIPYFSNDFFHKYRVFYFTC